MRVFENGILFLNLNFSFVMKIISAKEDADLGAIAPLILNRLGEEQRH